MAIELLKPFYFWFGLTNAKLALMLDVHISTVEKHQKHPEMRWREDTSLKLLNVLTQYLDRLKEHPQSRQQLIIEGISTAILEFSNVDLRAPMQLEVDRTINRLGLR
jgi:hypothetical protein